LNKNIDNYKPLELQEGFFLDKHYENYQMMDLNATSSNWKYNCTYQLLPNAIAGHHQILHLRNMQIAYSRREGGMMQDIYLADDTISIAVMEDCVDKVCFHRTKLKTGDIIFFDGGKSFNLVTNNTMIFRIITVHKTALGQLLPILMNALHKTIKDSDNLFSKTLKETWDYFTNETAINKKDFYDAQMSIFQVLQKLLEEQVPRIQMLTNGEEIALKIRKQIYNHMDAKINIHFLSKQHSISEKTMQNSFKSLYGFTPNKFLRYMKLNLVYHDLKYTDDKQTTVQKIANRWGFMNMGHFSGYYTKLFNENPSQTLEQNVQQDSIITHSCINRQEEIL